MAHPNEDLVRQGFAAYSRGDIQVHVFHVRDGKVTEVRTVQHDLYAWDEFWS